jgi:adenylate cyclase
MERRLAAILAADVVGYSRLMEADEEATARTLSTYREIVEGLVAGHYGRVFGGAGDSVVAEFASPVEAVRCAVNIQREIEARNAGLAEDRRMRLRIGVNLGDVMVEGDNLLGDGVNIAARLEALAEPGGISLARSVFDQVRKQLDLGYEDLGAHEVKNIAEPVQVYRVLTEPEAAGKIGGKTKRAAQPWKRVAAVAAVVLLIGVVGAVAWLRPWEPAIEPASVERMAFPLPDKPSIAVLPFTNMSGDPEQAYFADGMTDDLITDLSKLSGLFVISRNSTFAYKGTAVKVRQVAEDLGVRYVLEGSVRRVGGEVRINAQLIDATTGGHVWAERYDGTLTDIFDLQDRVISQIVTALAVNLTSAESAQTAEAETAVPAAYDALLQGWDHYRRQTPDDYAKAISFFEKAVELDPNYGRAYAGLAAVYWNLYNFGWYFRLSIEYQAIDKAKQNLVRALEHPTSDAYAVSAEMMLALGRNDEALVEVDRAVALAPSNAGTYISRAWILTVLGRAEEAENDARLAMRLDPRYPPSYLRVLGRALFHQERYQEAAETLERAVSRLPDYEHAYSYLAATYGHLGRTEDAKAAVQKYNEIVSDTVGNPLTLQYFETFFGGGWYDFDKTYLTQFIEGLRKAGVPEGAAAETADADFKNLVSRNAGTFDVKGAVKIDAAGAKTLFDRGVVFIDSRSNGPYGRGHIPNAINLYTNTKLTKEALAELAGLDQEIVFYCGGEDCPLSANACAKALVWGYTKVYYFAAGYPGWKKAGYPVETQ